MSLVIGIDGGGTRTRAILLDDTGHEHGRVIGPGSNPATQGWKAATQVIQTLLADLLGKTLVSAQDIDAIGMGLAGLTTLGDADSLHKALAATFPGATLTLHWDIEVALVGAYGRREGMLLLAGTGSAAYGISPTGKTVRVGGWGYLIGDEGSGFAVGRAALQAVMRAYDGRGPETALTGQLLSALNLPEPEAIDPWLYGGEFHPRNVARLAPLVCETARSGDPLAQGIIIQTVDDLLELLRAMLRGLQQEHQAARLVFMGGLLTAPDSYVAERLRPELARQFPLIQLVKVQHPPEVGAALLALNALEGRRDHN